MAHTVCAPPLFAAIVESMVSVRRLQDYLLRPEVKCDWAYSEEREDGVEAWDASQTGRRTSEWDASPLSSGNSGGSGDSGAMRGAIAAGGRPSSRKSHQWLSSASPEPPQLLRPLISGTDPSSEESRSLGMPRFCRTPSVLSMYPECAAVASEVTCTWGGQV